MVSVNTICTVERSMFRDIMLQSAENRDRDYGSKENVLDVLDRC